MQLILDNWTSNDFVELKKHLVSISESEFCEFSKKLIPNTEMLGVRVPSLRNISKKIAKGNVEEFLMFEPNIHEEILVYGFVVAAAKMSYDNKMFYIDKIINKLHNWAQVDMIAGSIKDSAHFVEIEKYYCSDKTFVKRFAVIRMLSSYVADDYIDRILDMLQSAISGDYYIDMAVAWLLSVCYVKYKDKTFVALRNIDKTILKMTKQKIRDSLRVSKEDKEILQTI